MSETKLYFLAPEFGILRDGSIALGNIIQDPASPTRVLSRLDPPLPSEKINISNEKNNAYSRSSGGCINASIWARFLQVGSVGAGGGGGRDAAIDYTMCGVETLTFKHDPTDAEATERAKDPSVQAAMDSGLFGTQPVYMVTAIKVARDFRHMRGIGSHIEGHANAAGAMSTNASVGGAVNVEHHGDQHDSAELMNDIVFAFRLHIISKKGWRKNRTEAHLFKSKAAFLTDDSGTPADAETMEVSATTEEDLAKLPLEGVLRSTENIIDGEESCVCISLTEI
ncbi:hypothetical protein V493_00712 [Pseudogymnoascus sp. VKM F-4281 (FW-2241)]|nr:hypothetical protein V493_00712 [Pseudogymnoascus sp. VKM F-4281 (FW-2241)]